MKRFGEVDSVSSVWAISMAASPPAMGTVATPFTYLKLLLLQMMTNIILLFYFKTSSLNALDESSTMIVQQKFIYLKFLLRRKALSLLLQCVTSIY